MENKKICSACNTENREDFQFCINCGARLPEAVNPQPETNAPVQETQAEAVPAAPKQEKSATPFYAPAQNTENPSELDTLAAFIGTNGYENAQKMLNMKMRFKKASWNWPVFLFGLFLGLPFVWFFYRKMYKQGVAVLLVTLAILLGSSFCIYGFLSPIFDAVSTLDFSATSAINSDSIYVRHTANSDSSWLDEEFERRFEDGFRNGYSADITDSEIDEMMSVLGPKLPQMMLCLLGIILLGLANLIFVILLAVFADNIYKNHCENKIAQLKNMGNCNAFALHSAGGTSTVAAVLSGILFTVGAVILSFVIIFSSMATLFNTLYGLMY